MLEQCLTLGQYQCQDQIEVRSINSIHKSVLKGLEKFLRSDTHHQEVAVKFCPKKYRDDYVDMIDMIACEIIPAMREDCFNYYEGKGPLIKDLYVKMLIEYEDQLCLTAAKVAVKMHSHSNYSRWGNVRNYLRKKGIHIPTRAYLDIHKKQE